MKKYPILLLAVLCLITTQTALATCPSADFSSDCKVNFDDFTIMASGWQTTYDANDLADMTFQWLTEGIIDMVWVYVDEPGSFTGEISKYETTNAQYCQFLNAALASGDITVVGNYVLGASEPYSGFVYYDLASSGTTNYGATNGGATRINYNGNSFSVDNGFDNHPVTCVNLYGATAFCNYYGYRLPTSIEWQHVANFDGSYGYGCGPTIDTSIANYRESTHPDGTTVVGSFGTYGYGLCDMAGNAWEWTSTPWSSSLQVLHGGSWVHPYSSCAVWTIGNLYPSSRGSALGFRAWR